MELRVRRLERGLEADFFKMREHPSCDWCFCMAWHVPCGWDDWKGRTAAQNRAEREKLFSSGGHDGYLLYKDDAPIGWCQAAPRAWLPKLAGQLAVPPEPGDWAIGCFEILPEHRKQGLSRALLDGVLADVKTRGAKRVLAFPRLGMHEDGKVWNGPFSLYTAAGFRPLHESEGRMVVELLL